MNICLRQATIVDTTQKEHHGQKRDILIEGGVIKAIQSSITPPDGCIVIERDNLHVSPSWMDTGVCFGEPGYEARETIAQGLKTAGLSGFGQVLLLPNTLPIPDQTNTLAMMHQKAAHCVVGLKTIGALTKQCNGHDLADLFDMYQSGAVGFFDYKKPIQNSHLLKIALQYTQVFNARVWSYPLDAAMHHKAVAHEGTVSTSLGLKGSPALAEELQISRDLAVLAYSGGKLHIPTISTAKAVELIGEAKAKGLDVTCSVAIHQLWGDESALLEFDTNTHLMPPLRTLEDQQALIQGLLSGVIDYVTSDHNPLDTELKRIEFDLSTPGSLGLEAAFGVLNQKLGMDQAVTLLQKGKSVFGFSNYQIAVGQPVDMSLFNPNIKYTQQLNDLQSTAKNSLYLGAELTGKAWGVITQKGMLIHE
jgi:dihydroorotase